MKRAYELTVLFAPDLTSEQLKKAQDAVTGHITTLGGKISKTDNWGRKLMAYRIQKHEDAVYVLYVFSLDAAKAQELEQLVKHTSGVIRHLCVLVEQD
ncbi:MAG TPA: 30S ribosomal protein S6 [Patescibacteria group bacterium]|nr:30S ribosomal protein S6 [Patescibacteria group bacterium]